jgi:hypothetical protein
MTQRIQRRQRLAVKEIWTDDNKFVINLAGSGWGVIYAFSIAELAGGASLSRMMNSKVRDTLRASEGGLSVSAVELKEVARGGVKALRSVVEAHFESKGFA